MEEIKSKPFQLSKEDIKKVGKGAVIAVSGALLTYITELIPTIDFGAYAPLIASIWAIIVNLAWKFIKDNSK